jgi:mRNA-degrading endonuclease YafQ of YafQ-DinJ toxin-antitoxin module
MSADREPAGADRGHFLPEAPDAFPILSAPAVVEVRKLAPEAIARWGLHDIDYVVFEPFRGGLRVRPAAIEDQVKYEQESGLGRVTYSLGEFLDEFGDAPSNPAPTFDRLAQFKRDYRKLTREQCQRFRAAAKKVIAPLSTTPPGEPAQPLVRELQGHPGFYEVYVDRDTRAVYTFGQAVRHGQPHIIWCRIGGQEALDKHTAVHAAVTEFR